MLRMMATLASMLLLTAAAFRVRRLRLRWLSRAGDQQQPLLVMSFGNYCFTARSLGVAGGRTFATPFDWIFSNPKIVSHVIATGGETLLNASEYVKPPVIGSTGCCHRTYTPMLTADPKKTSNKHGIVFSHHDPTRAEDHAYLRRSVARLFSALASPLPKLCVLVSLEKRGMVDESELQLLHETLAREANPAGHVELAVVKLTVRAPDAPHASAGLPASTSRTARRGNTALRVVEMTCRHGLCGDGLALLDPADRRDLLVAIFGPRATFEDGHEILTFPRLAADPLASAEKSTTTPPTTDVPEMEVRRLWCKSHNGVHAKYRDDGYMTSRAWAHCEERRRTELS